MTSFLDNSLRTWSIAGAVAGGFIGNRVDRKGKALTVKLQGPVEPYLQNE